MMAWTTKDFVLGLLSSLWKPVNLPVDEIVPWEEVYQFVRSTNLSGLIYWIILEEKLTPPPDVLDHLAKAYFRTIASNTQGLRQLDNLHRALTGLQIPFILLKGASAAYSLYPEPAPRLVGDIDLLIRQEQVQRCQEVMVELAYVPTQVEQQPGILQAFSNQQVYEPPDQHSAGVELHWHILDIPYYMKKIPMGWFWENMERMEIGGLDYQVLNPEASLIYSAAHLALHHRYKRLHSYLDLALLLNQRKKEIDIEKVANQAYDFELVNTLNVTLELLSKFWPGLPTSDLRSLFKKIKPSANDRRLFRLLTTESRSTTMDFYTTLVTLPDFPSRVRYAWANLFPQEAYMLNRYVVKRRWHLPYWYVYRLVSGFFKLGAMLPLARKVDRDPPSFSG